MPPTIDERLLLKKYALWVTTLEEHKKEAAKCKVPDDAEALKKKKRAAAVDAFKAAQARLGVTPQAVASAAAQRALDPPPNRAARTLAQELADDSDDDQALLPTPAATPAKAEPAASVQGSGAPEKRISDATADGKGADGKGTKRSRQETAAELDGQAPEAQKRRQGAPPRRKEDPEGEVEQGNPGQQPAGPKGTAEAAASRPERGQKAGKGRGEPGQRLRKPQRNPAATVFVGDLPPGTSDDDLRAAFAEFGELVGARVVPSKAYGFVDFKEVADAQALLASAEAHVEVQGRAVRIGPSGGPLLEQQKGPTAPATNVERRPSASDHGPPQPVHAPPARPLPESVELPDERQQIVYDDI